MANDELVRLRLIEVQQCQYRKANWEWGVLQAAIDALKDAERLRKIITGLGFNHTGHTYGLRPESCTRCQADIALVEELSGDGTLSDE